jgi:hypothetical protein
MRGDGRINRQKEQSPEGDARAKGPAHGEGQSYQQQSIERPHRNPRATLDGIEIVIEVDVFLREIALVFLVGEWADAAQAKARCRDKAADPELDERRMLWIDAKIGMADVRHASSDVISLIDRKAIEPGCYGGADDGSAHEREQDKNEEAQVDSKRLSMLDRQWRDRSAQSSSGQLNESQEKVE